MKKKLMGFAVALCFATVCAGSLAACSSGSEPKAPKGLQYELSEDGESYAVSGFDDPAATEVTIPAEHEGKPVTRILNGLFYKNTNVKKVTFSEGIQSIGQSFEGCTNLESVTLPNSLISISYAAFLDCDKITKEENGIRYVANWAMYCDREAKEAAVKSGTKGIANSAFYQCKKLTALSLPSGLNVIGGNAFSSCGTLAEISIPDSVTYIGADAFMECYGLTGQIAVPRGVKEIYSRTFFGCNKITSVTLCEGVTAIGKQAFSGCRLLQNLSIPVSVKRIEQNAFSGCTSLTNATYAGTSEQWSSVAKDEGWNGSGEFTIRCIGDTAK